MSTPAPTSNRPIDLLRARIDRLATDPRVRLVPDGAKIVFEVRAVLELLALLDAELQAHAGRLTVIERALASMAQLQRSDCD